MFWRVWKSAEQNEKEFNRYNYHSNKLSLSRLKCQFVLLLQNRYNNNQTSYKIRVHNIKKRYFYAQNSNMYEMSHLARRAFVPVPNYWEFCSRDDCFSFERDEKPFTCPYVACRTFWPVAKVKYITASLYYKTTIFSFSCHLYQFSYKFTYTFTNFFKKSWVNEESVFTCFLQRLLPTSPSPGGIGSTEWSSSTGYIVDDMISVFSKKLSKSRSRWLSRSLRLLLAGCGR